jgi:hypothetical protein
MRWVVAAVWTRQWHTWTLKIRRDVSAALVVVALPLLVMACGPAATLSSSSVGLAPNAPATQNAMAILFRLNHGNLNANIPVPPCSTERSRAIGPLQPPYKVCALSTAEGHIVTYTALVGSPHHGIMYSDRGPGYDECVKHLTGQWWEWQAANLNEPDTPCPDSWQFHGGP